MYYSLFNITNEIETKRRHLTRIILDFLYDRGEATCKDLGRAFEFSASTAYHHILIMSRAGLIKTRTKGKIIFYSIDKHFLNDVIELLRKYHH